VRGSRQEKNGNFRYFLELVGPIARIGPTNFSPRLAMAGRLFVTTDPTGTAILQYMASAPVDDCEVGQLNRQSGEDNYHDDAQDS
jgi:hypothetical protein